MNKFLSAALFVNVFLSPFLVVASDKDATAVYVSSSDVIDRGLGTTSFLSDNSAKSATTRMLHSLKGTKDFTPLHDKQQTSQKMTNFQSNNRQEPHVERNMSTQTFLTKSELQTAVNDYCRNPSEWYNHPNYALYGPIRDWDVSLITDMNVLFEGQLTCNPVIARWDVSNVKSFNSMFYRAKEFNVDISSWNVSKSVDFYAMFYKAKKFNQDLGDWDVSNSRYFAGMFWKAKKFNQNIGNWDVSNGTTFHSMFKDAKKFNQNIGDWDVSKGSNFNGMFKHASAFRQNLCGWDKSPTSPINDFCTGSYCGGDCSPTSEPSSAPSKPPSECKDSPLEFKIEEKKAFYTCSWVEQEPNSRCGIMGVTSTCPASCGTCSNCMDSPLLIKFVRGEKTKKNYCSWVAEKAKRCDIVGAKETCCDSCVQ